MNLSHLKVFVDAARFGSMTKSAEINHLSRPAVSHAIRNLENELKTNLIVHQRRAFELTAAGQTLLQSSDKLFDEIDRVRLQMNGSKMNHSRKFSIGCARALATFTLPKTLAKLRKLFPEVDFSIVIANSETLVENLVSKEVDVALYLGDDTLHGYREVVIGKGSFSLIQPRQNVKQDIAYALTPRRPETERVKTLFKRKYETEIPIFAEIPSWDAIWYWVSLGVCGGLVPDFLLEHQSQKNEFSVVFQKVFPYEIKALFAESKSNDALIQNFVKSLKS